jgi:malonyl-CoA decarboxylase
MPDETKPSLIGRTLSQLRGRWRDIAASARIAVGGAVRPDLPDEDAQRLRGKMLDCLEGRGGEVSARARAADLGRTFLTLNDEGRARFLALLAREFDADRAAIDAAIAAVGEAGDDLARTQAEARLRQALMPPWIKLLTQFNALPDGVKFLVDLRAELMELVEDDPLLGHLEADLRELLASWFDVGFLDLKRITWDAPATLLEKLIDYEAVHEIRSWSDLKNRLASDRRCFAFFHPRMPSEPLIFVEVALVSGMADSIQALLDEEAPGCDPNEADTAIFYSISNAQIGLAGVGFGGFLIKRVVDDLAGEFKRLKLFATLSPIPKFRDWLDKAFAAEGEGLLSAAEAKALGKNAGSVGGAEVLRALLDGPWDDDAKAMLKRPLMRLCARYLLREKGASGQPLAPTARFHLTNGARIGRINWLADTSSRGLRQSAGMMVNYIYKLDEIEDNHEAFTGSGKIAAAGAVRSLLRGQPSGPGSDE